MWMARVGREWVWSVWTLMALVVAAPQAEAQPRSEVRGFWVDTFNTTLNNHTDVVAVVERALAATRGT
jgi:uncharacterized lipoprotein YddW (UPF0748 family)